MNVKSNDQFDWLIGTGGTTSRFTGPSVDHTVGTSSGMLVRYFTYPEALLQHPLSDTRQYSICVMLLGLSPSVRHSTMQELRKRSNGFDGGSDILKWVWFNHC